ncbi:MAG: hypothetical protein AAGH64_09325, partial [Planctomycetota bacterium]
MGASKPLAPEHADAQDEEQSPLAATATVYALEQDEPHCETQELLPAEAAMTRASPLLHEDAHCEAHDFVFEAAITWASPLSQFDEQSPFAATGWVIAP